MLAAAAVKDWLAETGTPGRVRYYGCPAEEGGAAKAFMVRDGAFKDVDIAISWHPNAFLEVSPALSLANTRIDFVFHGRASHAAASPHLGRSALDAVELTNVGVNYMREHMPSDARIHYAMIDGGGIAPNVVQAKARVRYSVRAPEAAGHAGAAGAGQEHRPRRGADDRHAGRDRGAERRVQPDGQRAARAGDARDHAAPGRARMGRGGPCLRPRDPGDADAHDLAAAYRRAGVTPKEGVPLCDAVVPRDSKRKPMIGSTDVGDVSWVVPTVQAHAPTYAIGTPGHSWQLTAQGKSAAAHKGMVHVAKVMAATAVATLEDPALIAAAKADLAERTRQTPYVSPLPEGVEPPIAAMSMAAS